MNDLNVTTSQPIQTPPAEQSAVKQWIISAILRDYQWNDDAKLGKVQLYTQDFNWQCITFNNYFIQFMFMEEVTGYAKIIESVNHANEPIYVMIDFKVDDSLKALYFVHPQLCPLMA